MGKVLRDGVAGISARPADGVKEKIEFHHGLLVMSRQDAA